MVDHSFASANGMAVGIPAGGGIALEFLSARAAGLDFLSSLVADFFVYRLLDP